MMRVRGITRPKFSQPNPLVFCFQPPEVSTSHTDLVSIPYPIVEFEAAFEEPETGKGFKYSVRGALNFVEGEYTKTLRPIEPEDKEKFLTLIEQTATATIAEIRKSLIPKVAEADEPGGPIL
jgi:hypothetical protein